MLLQAIKIIKKAFYNNKGFPMKNKLKKKIKNKSNNNNNNNQQKTSIKPTNKQLP